MPPVAELEEVQVAQPAYRDAAAARRVGERRRADPEPARPYAEARAAQVGVEGAAHLALGHQAGHRPDGEVDEPADERAPGVGLSEDVSRITSYRPGLRPDRTAEADVPADHRGQLERHVLGDVPE